jgi:1-phosphatidylinositol-4-phosphate 5-kinase
VFDLKGSSLGRTCTAEERKRALPILKENDFLSAEEGQRICLGTTVASQFTAQVQADTKLLERMGIMDYSLLVGIHFKSRRGEAERHDLARGAAGDAAKLENEGDAPQDGYDVDASGSGSDGETDYTDAHASERREGGGGSRTLDSSTVGGGGGGGGGTGLPSSSSSSSSAVGPLSLSQHGTGAGFRIQARNNDVSGSGTDDERIRRQATSLPITDLSHAGSESPPSLVSGADGKGISGRDKFGKETDEIYYMVIIDILQQYDLRKLGETVFKSITMRSKASGISAVPPGRYASRFVEFLDKHSE